MQTSIRHYVKPVVLRKLPAAVLAILLAVALAAPLQAQEKAIESLRETGKAFASVAKKVSPAVVFIQVEKEVSAQQMPQFPAPFGDDFFRRFFGQPLPKGHPRPFQPAPKRRSVGQGSGFIVTSDGYILTNNHVVADADKVTVTLVDGRKFTAKTVGTDPRSDVAVIKIEAKDLPVLPLGDSDKLQVGEWVIAVGNPFGLSHTITAGIVSAKGRSSVGISDYENFIQTDAAINPGNSGGPLVNLDGQAIGMNTAIFSRSGGYMGIGFAIPINMIKVIFDQLVKTGHVTRGYLGIMIQDLTPELAKSFGLEDSQGVLVADVSKDSPAEKAGLKQGDVIVEFAGQPVKKVGPFRNRVALKVPGSKQSIVVLRDGKRKELSVIIGKLPEKAGAEKASSGPASEKLEKLGLTVQKLTPELAEQFGYKGKTGVLVSEVQPDSPAANAGIRRGVLIEEVNRQPVKSVEEFERIIEKVQKKGTILLLVREGQYSHYVALSLD